MLLTVLLSTIDGAKIICLIIGKHVDEDVDVRLVICTSTSEMLFAFCAERFNKS